MEEKKFPIYRFILRWNQDNYQDNGTSFSKMYKTEPSQEELEADLLNSKKFREDKNWDEGHPIIEWLEARYEYVEHESWVLGWFNHMTYNQFETDEEIERSFQNFIDRKMLLNRQNGHGETEANYSEPYNPDKPFYCFMGAEGRWRWKICRCEHCVAAGKITIDH